VFWPLQSSSEFLGVMEDSNFSLLRVWVSSSHLSQSGVAKFPFIIYFVPLHEAHIQMAFYLGIPKTGVSKFSKLGLSRLWAPITLCVDLQLRWGLKQSCSPCQDVSNGMWHDTWMQENWGDSRLLVVGSQIFNLTLNLSFGHNMF
jgi:hypothetical protein